MRETGLSAIWCFLATFVVTLLIAGALASLTFRYIEMPFVELGKRRTVKAAVA
jgi:peptidoglycan/LPS O-acetylase OafA/YrhL